MADFEFLVPVAPIEREFAGLMLRHLQRMATSRLCDRTTQIHYRWYKPKRRVPYHHYRVKIEGDFAEIQALATDVIQAIPHFAAGVTAVNHNWRSSMLPHVIPIALFKATVEFNDEFADFNRQIVRLGVPVLTNSYLFAEVGEQMIDAKLRALTQVLLAWRSNRVKPETVAVAEQIHTTIELLLKQHQRAPNRGISFQEMVEAAHLSQIISKDEVMVLRRLRGLRKDAKHRGQSIGQSALNSILQTCVGVLHRLVAHVQIEEQANAG